jgi:hypothetical protein
VSMEQAILTNYTVVGIIWVMSLYSCSYKVHNVHSKYA